MTTKVAPAAVPGPLGDPGAAAARRPRSVLRQARDLAGVLPFTVYVLIGLVLPMGAILLGAFKTPVTGAFTWHNLHIASHGIYLHGFATSMELSLIASVVPGILGFLVAYAIYTAKHGAVLRRVAITASGVFANFGGVPLAFLFIATLGNTGLATQWLTDVGFNPYNNGFDLYGLGGVALVYMYFQIPLMVLVILPAFEGLRPAWREAALRILAGFETADAGSATVNGKDISLVPAAKRDMGMVFQSYSLFPNMSALENVGSGLRMRRIAGAERRRRAGELLDMVGLTEHARRYPTSCPAVSSSASRSPARWRSSLRSCCLTSRSRHSMPRSGCSCGSRSGPCSSGSARRPFRDA